MSITRLAAPEGYEPFLKDLKERIRTAQVRAALAVNRELVLLYWSIGKDILTQQKQHGWGAKIRCRRRAQRPCQQGRARLREDGALHSAAGGNGRVVSTPQAHGGARGRV
jgi:hypothetical protein